MKTIVPHFGLHTAGGMDFLLQGEGSVKTASFWSHASPFETNARRCPHQIDLNLEPEPEEWDQFVSVLDDPLVREMLPIPKLVRSPAYFACAADDEETTALWAASLELLGSPISGTGGRAIWATSAKDVANDLVLSNITPVLVTWAAPQHTNFLMQLAMTAQTAPRRLVAVGGSSVAVPPMYRRLRTGLAGRSVPDLDWRAVGSRVLREYMLDHNAYASP